MNESCRFSRFFLAENEVEIREGIHEGLFSIVRGLPVEIAELLLFMLVHSKSVPFEGFNVLQCVAMCCSVLQCVAVCCACRNRASASLHACALTKCSF